jgi:RNA polymerase primary sigma factor
VEWATAVGEASVSSLKKQIRRSQRAKAAMIEANLRNVVTIARQIYRRQRRKSKDTYSTISFQDLCQQGILGLIKACERFDPQKGVRFYTYANWYIQQEVQRSIQHDRHMIRLPTNAIAHINAIRIAEVQLSSTPSSNTNNINNINNHHLNRKPTDEDIAKHLGMSVEKVQFYKRSAREALSIHSNVNNSGKKKGSSAGSAAAEEDGFTLEHMLHDPGQETPTDLAAKQMLQEDVRRLIQTLTPREQAVIRLRFGLDDGQPKTLEAIGQQFAVSKERIRKIESNALLKLRQPYRHESVKSYVSDL